jgi:5-(hydroxymethyl)furfural/furfural oxidase
MVRASRNATPVAAAIIRLLALAENGNEPNIGRYPSQRDVDQNRALLARAFCCAMLMQRPPGMHAPSPLRTSVSSIPPMTDTFDTIIIGGGAAGCVLANRLSARSSAKILLLEAGADTPPGKEPADVLDTYATSYYNDAYFWPGLKVHWRRKDNSPPVSYLQGRIMGGGSSVMGMVAFRGTPDDYAEWEAQGAAGWGWTDVLPYYRKLENELDFIGELHGRDGPVPIRRTKSEDWAPLSKAVHAFAQERQIPFIADMNADFRDGYGAVPMSNWPHKRASAAICYLDTAVRARSNLRIINRATATGLLFDGRRVTGVTARIDGAVRELRGREIILSAGGVHSPAFLMRAGIGAAGALRDLGIEVRADLPGVGENLSNHAIIFLGLFQHRHQRQAASVRPHPMTALRYSSGLPGAPPADMYINVQCKTSWSALGFQVANLAPTLLKPMARGRVSLTARDAASPCVEFNFTGHELDLKRFMQGFRLAVEILTHERVRAMSGITFPVKFDDRLRRLNRITPANRIASAALAAILDFVPPLAGPIFSALADRRVELAALVQDDAALAEHIRQNVAGMFHPVGTCRMGAAGDRDAVVDPTGRVRGVGGLRVVDASIMPTLPRGNTNIPTIMVAEKIAKGILDQARAAA